VEWSIKALCTISPSRIAWTTTLMVEPIPTAMEVTR
jgi:hypothetical protein